MSTTQIDCRVEKERIDEYPHPPLLFIGGLHRSGTSMICRCLGQHPQVSVLSETGAPEDEGQHLQDVYPPGRVYGGPGRFGFSRQSHITEHSTLVSPANAQRLLACWKDHWNGGGGLYVEKSPPNLVRSRFLQSLFPRAHFLMVVRHPVPVTLATKKWTRTRIERLFAHWARCHEIMSEDLRSIASYRVIRYEDFVADPQATIQQLQVWMRLPTFTPVITPDTKVNTRYFDQWMQFRQSVFGGWRANRLIAKWSATWEKYGYMPDGATSPSQQYPFLSN